MVWQIDGDASGVSDVNNSGGFRGGASIAAPSTPAVTGAATGGTVAAGTYYIVNTYNDGLGETVISAQTSVTVSGATSKFTVTSPSAATNALTWSSYCATVSGGPYFPISTGMVLGVDLVRTTTPPTTGTQPRGVDRSLVGTRTVVIDNSTITATTTAANSNTLTFTGGYTPSGSDVGNTCRITAGTNMTAGDYEITAVTTTTWTLSGAANATGAGGAGAAIVGGMGGCFATPGQCCAFVPTGTGNTAYLKAKAGVYTTGSGTNNTAGNKFTVQGFNFVGYSTNRTPLNTDTPPVLDAGGASMTVVSASGGSTFISNISITNSGNNASVTGWSPANGASEYRRVSVTGCAVSVASGGTQCMLVDCSDSGCGGMAAALGNSQFVRYVSLNGTGGKAIFASNVGIVRECIVTGQGGTNSVGISAGGQCVVSNCVAAGNSGSTAIGIQISDHSECEDCIVSGYSGTGAIGYGVATASGASRWRNCADYNNTIPYSTSILAYQKVNCVALGGDPFTNVAGNDFSLNNNSGAGAACRQAGIPGTWVGLSTTGYRSIGVAEPAAITPGGIPHLAGRGGGLAG